MKSHPPVIFAISAKYVQKSIVIISSSIFWLSTVTAFWGIAKIVNNYGNPDVKNQWIRIMGRKIKQRLVCMSCSFQGYIAFM